MITRQVYLIYLRFEPFLANRLQEPSRGSPRMPPGELPGDHSGGHPGGVLQETLPEAIGGPSRCSVFIRPILERTRLWSRLGLDLFVLRKGFSRRRPGGTFQHGSPQNTTPS